MINIWQIAGLALSALGSIGWLTDTYINLGLDENALKHEKKRLLLWLLLISLGFLLQLVVYVFGL